MGAALIDGEVAARCHANCIEYAREGARRSGPAGEIVERDGVLLFASASDFPVFANGTFRLDPAVPAEQVIDRADAWFGERGRGWSLGTTSWGGADQDLAEAAAARGLLAVTDTPGMVCDERLPDAPVPDGVEVRVLTTQEESEAFVAMADQAYTSLGLPAGVISAMSTTPMRLPVHEVTVGAFDGADLLSGAQVFFSHGIAGVYCVGTAEAARGRGLAELVTRTVTNLGFDGGAPYVTLQASPMGEPIYRRMGYRELYRYATHARFV
jgi:ribosomal protein S18 acetylase RimI-like enzyme